MARVAPTEVEKESLKEKYEKMIAPAPVNKYDTFALKGAIDDYIVELLEEKKFSQKNIYTYLRIFVGAICCAIGAYSYMGKMPFDVRRPIVIASIVCYVFY